MKATYERMDTPALEVETRFGSMVLRLSGFDQVMLRMPLVEGAAIPVRVNGVIYEMHAYFNRDEKSGRFVLEPKGLFLQRADNDPRGPTVAVRAKLLEELPGIVNLSVAENQDLLVRGERVRINNLLVDAEARQEEGRRKWEAATARVAELELILEKLGAPEPACHGGEYPFPTANCGLCHTCGTMLVLKGNGEEWCQACRAVRTYRSHSGAAKTA